MVEDPWDHPRGDVLDVAVVGELGLRRQRRRHPEEGGEPAEQGHHVVRLGLLPEQLLQLFDLLRVLLGEVVRLGEVIRKVVELRRVAFGIPDAGCEPPDRLRIDLPGDARHHPRQPPAVLVHPPVAEDLEVLLRVPLGGAGIAE